MAESMALLLVWLRLVCVLDAGKEPKRIKEEWSLGLVGGAPKLVIDHDGGADDAMAIFVALLYEEYFNGPKVLALTTSHGNVDEDQTFLNTQRLLDIAERRDVPIYRGSNFSLVINEPSDQFFGSDGLGDVPGHVQPIPAQPEPAAVGLIELTRKYPGEIAVVVLGALTNIALAIRLDPAFLDRVSTLYIAVGHDSKYPKYNVYQDVEAYHVVAQNASPETVTIVAYADSPNITTEWRKNVLGKIDTKIMHALNEFERISLNSDEQIKYWDLLDPIAMAAVLDYDVINRINYSQNNVVLCGENRGQLMNNFTTVDKANMEVIREIDAAKCQELLYCIFAAEVNC